MDSHRSILSPLGDAAKNLSAAAANLAELRPRLADVDTDAIRERVSRTAQQLAISARRSARAASAAAAPYLHEIASASQHGLRTLGDNLEANARAVAKRWSGKRGNVLARHPIAATMLMGSLGYLTYRAWKRSHSPQLAAAKPKSAPRKRAARKTNSTGRTKAIHAGRSSAVH